MIYCIPAGWVWGEHGFLKNLGAVDIAGGGPVHLIGGTAAFASAVILGPRIGRYSKGNDPLPMGNPVIACMGCFVLWWGWLAFNSGSTYGVSGYKWQYAARAAVMTMMGSFGGGICSLFFSMLKNSGNVDVCDLINGILGALVSVTAGCFLFNAWEALVIGMIGAFLVRFTTPIFDRFSVDDPVGASSVHGVCGIWSVLSIGFFADNPIPLDTTNGRLGLFKGGGWYLLGIQALTSLCLTIWGVLSTYLLLWIIDKIVPVRMDFHEELLGADVVEHRIKHGQIGISRAISALAPLKLEFKEFVDIPTVGGNVGHETHLEELRIAGEKIQKWREFEESAMSSPNTFYRKRSLKKRNTNNHRGSLFDRGGRSKVSKFNSNSKFGINGIYTQSRESINDRMRNSIPTVSNQVELSNKRDQNFAWVE